MAPGLVRKVVDYILDCQDQIRNRFFLKLKRKVNQLFFQWISDYTANEVPKSFLVFIKLASRNYLAISFFNLLGKIEVSCEMIVIEYYAIQIEGDIV